MLMVILFLCIIFMLSISYRLFDKDLISPAFVYTLGYSLSSFMAALNVNYWKVDLTIKTVLFVILGIATFIFSSYLIYLLYKRKTKFKIMIYNEPICYNKKLVCMLFIIETVLLYFWYVFLVNTIASLEMLGGAEKGMEAYRYWSSYTTEAFTDKNYLLLTSIKHLFYPSMFVLTAIGVYNYTLKRDVKEDIFIWLTVIVMLFEMLLEGSRGGVVSYIITVCMLNVLFNYFIYNKFSINLKRFGLIVGGVVLCSWGFVELKNYLGRNDTNSFFNYISMYIGGQIPLFDLFLKEPIYPSNVIGKETFTNLIQWLMKWGILDADYYIWHLEFRYSLNGILLGNSYPSFRSYYYDFGLIGIIVLPAIFSFIVSAIYYYIRYNSKQPITPLIIFYSYIFNTIFFDFSKCIFFAGYFHFGTLKTVMLFFFYCFMFVPKYRKCIVNCRIKM